MGTGKLLLELNKLFSIIRWNNRPGILKFSEADNAYHGILLSLFTLGEEEKETIVLNTKYRIISELPKIILSDVSLETKKRIKQKKSEIWDEVITKANEDLKSIDIDTYDKLYDTLVISDELKEMNNIINLLVARKETELNARVFPEFYLISKEEIEENLKGINNKYSDKLETISENILNLGIRMNSITRWNTMHRNVKTTVSAHSFFVLTIAVILGLLNEADDELLYEIIVASALHDLPEAFTGDVITPTKRKVQGLEEIISQVENEMLKEWIEKNNDVKDNMNNFLNYMIEPFNSEYGKYVRTADLIALIIECGIEIKTGNQNDMFRKAFFSAKKEIKNIAPFDVTEIIDELEYNIF